MKELFVSSSFQDIIDFQKAHLTSNDIYIDVGANDGSTTLWAIRNCNPLHCYLAEACPAFDTYLPQQMKDFADNNRYTIIKKLVLDKPGEATLYWPEMSPSQSSLYDRFTRNKESVIPTKLPVTTIDEIVKEFHINNPIVMKIDTELSEPLVWKGMKRSLPIIRDIIMEFMPGAMKDETPNNPQEFLEEIKSDGFEILDIGGFQQPLSSSLSGGGKTDIYLRNTRYGYIE